MSWYVLQCRVGREAEMVNSLNQHLSREALEEAFYFQSERLWRSEGSWKRQKKELFPGYVFLQSENPGLLSEALEEYRQIVRIMEGPGWLLTRRQCRRELCELLGGRSGKLTFQRDWMKNSGICSTAYEGRSGKLTFQRDWMKNSGICSTAYEACWIERM